MNEFNKYKSINSEHKYAKKIIQINKSMFLQEWGTQGIINTIKEWE